MHTNWLGVIAVGALVGTYGVTASAAPPDMDEVPLTLSGCVVAGEKKDSYMLTNVVVDGATTPPANAFYRFNTTKGLKAHVGHRVEVKGKADFEDADKGKVKIRTDDDGKVTTQVTSERRTVTVENTAALFGSMGAKKLDAEIATYKFNVDSVKMLQGNCASASAAQ